nr:LacI family DNA-binding transcriptional regulator [Allorhizobium sonneratiae]
MTDVAEKVGVSPITVSRAISRPEKVSDDLRETILQAVHELGYVPDYAARALASRSGHLIGVLSSLLGSSTFAPVMKGIEDRARNTGQRIQYANTLYDPQEEIHQIKQFFGQKPTGIIIGGVKIDPQVTDLLRNAPCPVVQLIDISYPAVDMAVGVNNPLACEAAISHMIDAGYRSIAFCSIRADIPILLRLERYRQRMTAAGLYRPELELMLDEQASAVRCGADILDRLFQQVPDLDAIFCAHDDLALGVLFECQRRGIAVPEKLGLCGFADMDYAACTVPSLTTLKMPLYQLGYRAVDMILRAKEGFRTEKTVDLGFELVKRQSTDRKS